MINVLHYTPGFLLGGIESRLLDWYRNIDRTKFRFILIKMNDIDDTDNIKEFLSMGGKVYNLPPIDRKTIFKLESNIRKIIRKESVDIIHVHDLSSGIFALKAAKKEGIDCRILHSRSTNFLPNEKNLFIKKFLKYNTARYSSKLFACSVEAGNWGFGKKYENQFHVIKNGIQDELFEYNDETRKNIRRDLNVEDKIVIGSVGRLSEQKNIPFLLDVFSEISKESDKYVLLLVGDGDRSILTNYYSNNDISKKIIHVGNKKDTWNYYMAMDVFCGASLYEGFGTTAIEAQATGLPTILSIGFPEVVELCSFAKRIPDYDVDVWCNEIRKAIGNRYPKEGIEAVRDAGYSAKIVAKELERIYKE